MAERSQEKHVAEKGAYSIITDERNGGKKAKLNKNGVDFTINWGILEETETLKPVDNLIMEDVREINLDADIIFTNNVFDYLGPEETTEVVDSISSKDGAFLETVSINYGASTHRQEEIEESDSVEILAEAPPVNFWWAEFKEEYKNISQDPYEGVRIFQPAQS